MSPFPTVSNSGAAVFGSAEVSMSVWLVYRLLKFVAFAAFAAGIGLSSVQTRQSDRVVSALWVATPALWFSWLAGYLLMKATSRTLSEAFVLVGMLASFTALHGAILSASKPSPMWVSRALGPAGLAVTTAVMVTRDQHAAVIAGSSVVAALVAAGMVALAPSPIDEPDPRFRQQVYDWFVAVARVEGLSLITMILISMPLRRATGIHLDGGTGALGWGHGVLVLIYLQTLAVAARALGWTWGKTGLAFVASLFPFGTIVFERFGLGERPA